MKVGLFGGSFDPIHRGHVEPVRNARLRLGLDLVVFLPTARPPHKEGRQFAPPHARFAMTELALLDDERMLVSPYELTLDRPAYTVATLEHFRSQWPDANLHLLLGEDSFRDLGKWERWRDILRLARLVVLARPGFAIGERLTELPAELQALYREGDLDWIAELPIAVSSTEVREALQAGTAPPGGALAPSVVQYIDKYSLYR